MMTRVVGLGDHARRVVDAAAVGDGHLGDALLRQVCGLPDEDFAAAVSEAVASSVLEGVPDADGYRFRHALLREAVERALLPAERRGWHRRWGEELELEAARTGAGATVIAAAQHWFATDDVVQAFDAGVKAENAAWTMRASVEQARLCQQIIDLLPRVPSSHTWQNVRVDFAWTAIGALTRSGDWAEQLALAERELQHAEAALMPAWRIYLDLVRRDCSDLLGHPPAEPLDVEADVAQLLVAAPDNLLTMTLIWYHDVVAELGLAAQAARLLERASEVCDAMVAEEVAGRPPGNNPPDGVSTPMKNKMLIEVMRADQEWFAGNGDQALARVTSLMPLARRPGAFDGPDHVVFRVYAGLLTRLGRSREAVDVGREAVRLLGPVGPNRVMWLDAVAPLAKALFTLGEWEEVEGLLREAEESNPRLRSTAELALAGAGLCGARGELDAAGTWLVVAGRAMEGHRDPATAAPYRWLLAELAAARGDVSLAREHLEPCWEWPEREVEWHPLSDLFLLAARLEADSPDAGSPDRVARIRERAHGMPVRGDLGRAWSAQLRAELLRYDGSTDPGPWVEAAAAWARIEHLHQQGWALVRQAACLVARGDRPAATAPLADAFELSRRLGARPLTDAVVAVARRGRLTVGPQTTRTPDSSLTERERDVLRLLAEGYSNGRIAETLFISPKTASVHVSHILTKLDVATRTGAAAFAIRHGLVDEHEAGRAAVPSDP